MAEERKYRHMIAVLVGVTLLLAFAVARAGDLFSVVNRVINGVGSPLFALMLLGMFSRTCNAQGALYGGGVGMIISVAVSFGVEGMALHYYAVVNAVITALACLVASAVTSRRTPVTPGQLAWTWWGRMHASNPVP